MKKSKLQVLVEFVSHLKQMKPNPKQSSGQTEKQAKGKRMLVLAFFLLLGCSSFATTYYSAISGGNWTVNSTWSTVGYGNATNLGTYPKVGDIANIGNTYTVYINSSVNCATLNIGQGSSGVLDFLATGNYTLTVSGNITVNTGAKFRYNTATIHTHTCNVGGNFSNFGAVDFYVAAGQVVNLVFNGAGNSVVSGIGTWDLNTVTLNKGATTATMNVMANAFELSIKSFVGTFGTYIHNNVGTYNINPTPATFTIGPNMIFKVPQGTMWFASAADNLYLQGALYVNGGNVKVGTTAGLQGIRSDQNGATVPYLDVSAGTLTVYGGITYGTVSSSEPLSFHMTGGNILLNCGTNGTNRQVFYINDVAGSIFFMSGGTITMQKPNTAGSATIDFSVCGTSGTVTTTNGTVQFGNASTAAGVIFNFRPYAGVIQPNFKITGNAGTAFSLATSNNSTASFKLLSLYIDVNKTFDIRSITGTTGDTKTMTLLATANGTDAFYNNGTFTARSSTVTFNTTGAQGIGGTNVTTFYNLSINNSSDITLNKAANVSNFLSMVLGKLITTNTNVLTCLSAANASIGATTTYVDGPMVHTVATAASTTRNYPIGKGSDYRPLVLTVQHTNATSVTYRSEIFNSPASALPFILPPTIANVSNVRFAKFTRQAVANFSTGRIQMFYNLDDGVADKNTLLVAHDNGTTTWQNFGGVATANGVGNILSNVFNNFNTYFALGNPPGGGNPLPIELASFDARLRNKTVQLSWITRAEVNNDFFTVERSSDNDRYAVLGTVDGSGNTSQMNSYGFTDQHPPRGISYYRLRQTDFNGHEATFPVRVINNMDRTDLIVYPNPCNMPVVHVSNTDGALNYSEVTVQDITGRTISARTYPESNGDLRLEFDQADVRPGGVYIIRVNDGEQTLQQLLLMQ